MARERLQALDSSRIWNPCRHLSVPWRFEFRRRRAHATSRDERLHSNPTEAKRWPNAFGIAAATRGTAFQNSNNILAGLQRAFADANTACWLMSQAIRIWMASSTPFRSVCETANLQSAPSAAIGPQPCELAFLHGCSAIRGMPQRKAGLRRYGAAKRHAQRCACTTVAQLRWATPSGWAEVSRRSA